MSKKEELFCDKPFSHWKAQAIDYVMDTLVRGMVPDKPYRSIIHALSTKMLRDLALQVPEEFHQKLEERERFKGDTSSLSKPETDEEIWAKFLARRS